MSNKNYKLSKSLSILRRKNKVCNKNTYYEAVFDLLMKKKKDFSIAEFWVFLESMDIFFTLEENEINDLRKLK